VSRQALYLHFESRAALAVAVAQLTDWGELSEGWTVDTAGDWLCALSSVKLW